MYQPVIVYKRRTNVVLLNLGINISSDVITSEIRAEDNSESELLATWLVSFVTDGTDGKCILTIDDSALTAVGERTTGFMDAKRFSGGEPLPVFDAPLQVVFRESITA